MRRSIRQRPLNQLVSFALWIILPWIAGYALTTREFVLGSPEHRLKTGLGSIGTQGFYGVIRFMNEARSYARDAKEKSMAAVVLRRLSLLRKG